MSSGEIELTEAGGRRWRFDADFLASNWECRWGVDCQGIGDEPTPELGQGCCSVGAEVLDAEEAMNVAALGLGLDPDRFQHHGAPALLNEARNHTAVVDGACVFLNRPGFAGGAGCALHLGALDAGESPIDWKPSICWQLPLKIETVTDTGTPVSLVRPWTRGDWGVGGETMAWCCTEQQAIPTAFAGDRPVIETLRPELEALLGSTLCDRLAAELGRGSDGPAS